MYFTYLWQTLKRAITPAPRITDMLQILAASALPATGKFVGINLPSDSGDSALAYIGLIAISFVIIRLFWAPYAIWQDQNAKMVALRLELSKPERLMLEYLAKHKAKARKSLSTQLHKMHFKAFPAEGSDVRDSYRRLTKQYMKLYQLCHSCAMPEEFHGALHRFQTLCRMRIDGKLHDAKDFDLLNLMQSYIYDSITIEDLERQLPPIIEPET